MVGELNTKSTTNMSPYKGIHSTTLNSNTLPTQHWPARKSKAHNFTYLIYLCDGLILIVELELFIGLYASESILEDSERKFFNERGKL